MKEGADSHFTCLVAQTLEEALYNRIRACMIGPYEYRITVESQALRVPLVKSRILSPFPLSLMLSPKITSFFGETADAAASSKSRQI